MPRVFVYEYVTGGGTFSESPPGRPEGSLLREGTAMIRAVVEDFLQLGAEVIVLRDERLEFQIRNLKFEIRNVPVFDAASERAAFCEVARRSDWTLVIAPEIGGALATRSRWVIDSGGRLLSPDPQFVAIAADKQLTAETLDANGIRVPSGTLIRRNVPAPIPLRFPAVLKPRDGCGSFGVARVNSFAEAVAGMDGCQEFRLEEFVPGFAASVAVLCGPAGFVSLPACSQEFSDDGAFQYRGGISPLPADLNRRAQRLALAAVQTLPRTTGYVGVDLVLGTEDHVIEINPRLTTSYVGLRQVVNENLAGLMIAVAEGRPATASLSGRAVRFSADGTIGPGTATA